MVPSVINLGVDIVSTDAAWLSQALGLVAAIGAIVLLAIKVLANTSDGPRRSMLASYLDVGIVPLIMVSAMNLVTRIL